MKDSYQSRARRYFVTPRDAPMRPSLMRTLSAQYGLITFLAGDWLLASPGATAAYPKNPCSMRVRWRIFQMKPQRCAPLHPEASRRFSCRKIEASKTGLGSVLLCAIPRDVLLGPSLQYSLSPRCVVVSEHFFYPPRSLRSH